MDIEEVPKKAKELIFNGNFDKANQFIEEYQEFLGNDYDIYKEILSTIDPSIKNGKVRLSLKRAGQ
ncbi:TPA: hypothetical protein ACHU8X_002562 [Enterococcus faecalis]